MYKFIFLIFILTASLSAVAAPIIVKSRLLKEYVLRGTLAELEDVATLTIKAARNKGEIILLSVVPECGSGTCTQFAFKKNKRGDFDFLGKLNGLFVKTQGGSLQYPVIVTEQKNGDIRIETFWTFNTEKFVYESN